MAIRPEHRTQARAAYEVLTKEGFRCFIGTKPHNCHVVSVLSGNRKAIQRVIHMAFHKPEYSITKVKGKEVIMLHFIKPESPLIEWGATPPVAEGGYGE
jgi:hypothetical protein